MIKDKLQNADTELKTARRSGEPQSKAHTHTHIYTYTHTHAHTRTRTHTRTQMIVDRQARQLEGHVSTFNDLMQKEKASTQQNPLDAGNVSPAPTPGMYVCDSSTV